MPRPMPEASAPSGSGRRYSSATPAHSSASAKAGEGGSPAAAARRTHVASMRAAPWSAPMHEDADPEGPQARDGRPARASASSAGRPKSANASTVTARAAANGISAAFESASALAPAFGPAPESRRSAAVLMTSSRPRPWRPPRPCVPLRTRGTPPLRARIARPGSSPGTTSRQPPGVRPRARGGRSIGRAATKRIRPRRFWAAYRPGPEASPRSARRTWAAGQASRSASTTEARRSPEAGARTRPAGRSAARASRRLAPPRRGPRAARAPRGSTTTSGRESDSERRLRSMSPAPRAYAGQWIRAAGAPSRWGASRRSPSPPRR
jgi:hypothetical protein